MVDASEYKKGRSRAEQAAKFGGEGLEVLVERIPQDIVIEVPDEVDQALLLLAR